MNKNNLTGGILLIIAGCLLFANQFFNLRFFSMGNFWPLFILLPGLAFEFSYFASGRNPGLLVPGGILTTIGFLFLFQTFTNWIFIKYTWPVFILSVAIGLSQLYIFSNRSKGLLIPIFILTGISLFFFAVMFFGGLLSWLNSGLVVPVILILAGVVIILGRSRG